MLVLVAITATAKGMHVASTAQFQVGRFGGAPPFNGTIDEILVTQP